MGQETSKDETLPHDAPTKLLKDRTITSFASHLKASKQVVVLTGAGISTSAGIPDFRSPDTGLYANLARLNLPYPEAVFDISFFRQNPMPFYMLAKELYPGKFFPTVSHAFIALLAKKGLLKMLFTQNIDCLERRAGVPDEKVVEAHGSFASQRCIDCGTPYSDAEMRGYVQMGVPPNCLEENCGGLVKPDIVFFGEQLPKRFFETMDQAGEGDAMIVVGTSLTVAPFAHLPDLASRDCPRLLINMEQVGGLGSRPDDVLLLGDIDSSIRRLADELGWREELEALYREVGGPNAQEPIKEQEKPAAKAEKHEDLEDEIEKLTSEVDHALKITSGHKEWLEKHLEKKSDAGPKGLQDMKKAAPAPESTLRLSAPLKRDDIFKSSEEIATQSARSSIGSENQDSKTESYKLEHTATDEEVVTTPEAPLEKPERHNETLAAKRVDDLATPDIASPASHDATKEGVEASVMKKVLQHEKDQEDKTRL